jgi:branched-chain amino acid transport system permease protein
MTQLVVLSLLNGVVYGLLLFMLSSGLTLIYGMMGVLNLAHASFYMLGAYFAYTISLRAGFWPALFFAPILCGLIGAAVERWGLRAVHKHGHGAEMLFTFGLALIIQELVPVLWGRLPVDYRIPQALARPAFIIFGTEYPSYRLFMAAVSIGMFSGLFVLLKRTRIGLVVQAALTHPDIVAMLGHNVPRIFTLVFGIGSGLAALAGAIGGNVFTTEPGMAQMLGAIIFVVVVIGGLGSLAGALLASVLIGIIQSFAVAADLSLYSIAHSIGTAVPTSSFWSTLFGLTLSRLAPLLPFLLLVLTLVIRPSGLMGQRET